METNSHYSPKLKSKQNNKQFSSYIYTYISAFDGEDGKNWILNLKTGHNARILLSFVIIHDSIMNHCSGQKGIQARLRTVACVWMFYYFGINKKRAAKKVSYLYNEFKTFQIKDFHNL